MQEINRNEMPGGSPGTELPYREETGLKPASVWPDVLVLAGCLFVLCWGIGRYGLYEPHEGHFAGVGREMLLSGDWLTPRLNGSPYLNKPPLLYWSLGFSQKLFGINEWAARFPLALYGWLGVVVAWAFGREVFGRATGRLAAGFLTTSAGWFLFTHQLLIDALLSSLQLAAVYGFWRATREPERRRHWLCFYGSMSLALMAKGPVGMLFPLVAALGYLLVRGRWSLLRQARLWWGLPLVVAPVSIWALLVESRNPGFLHHIILNENLNRLADTRWPRDYGGVQVSPINYLATAAIWCAPWILFVPEVARKVWRWGMRCEPVQEMRRLETGLAAPGARCDGVLVLALAALGPVILFLPVPSRLVYYCLPAVPPFMVLAAGWWIQSCGLRASRLLASILMLVLGSAVFSAGFWVVPLIQNIPDLAAAPDTLHCIPWMAWMFGLGLFFSGVFFVQARPRAAGFWACALCALAWTFAVDGFVGYQDVRSSKRLVEYLDPRLGPDATWISEGSNELGTPAGMAYYLGRDEFGRARTVFVLSDDERRPQPEFAPGIPRQWAMTHSGLEGYWASKQPVVFVTDPMRRDWVSIEEAPRLPEDPGAPVMSCGFRRVYLNQAAREWVQWHDLLIQMAYAGRERLDDMYYPEKEKRLPARIVSQDAAAAEIWAYIQEWPALRQLRWSGLMSDGEMYYMLSSPGGEVSDRMAVYGFKNRDFIRFYAPQPSP